MKKQTFVLNILFIAIIFLGGCSLPKQLPVSSPTPTSTTQPSLSSPTPTQIVGLKTVIDDGKPVAPQVISYLPRGGQGLSTRGNIELTFDQPMDPSTTASAWSLVDENGNSIEGDLSWPKSQTMVFKPNQSLKSSARYLASLSTKATSKDGVALADIFKFQFNTVSDLEVTQVFPAADSKDVAVEAVITVIFNRPVVPLVIIEDKSTLLNPLTIEPSLPGKGEWVSTSVFAFKPDQTLKGSTTYTITVPAGLTDATKDTVLNQAYTWHFSTIAPELNTITLLDGTINPPEGYKNVPLDEAFRLTFNQPMNSSNTEGAVIFEDEKGERPDLTTAWDDTNTTLILTPTQRLALGTQYSLRVSQNALSANGGNLARPFSWTFTSMPPPSIRSTTPADGTNQKKFDGSLRIKFASPMNLASIKERIKIAPPPDEDIDWWYNDYDWSVSGYGLKPSTKYEVHFLPGMMDIYSNTIEQETVIRFRTAAYEPQAELQMPYMPAVFRVGGPQEFYVSYRNIETLEVKLYSITPEKFTDILSNKVSLYKYSPTQEDLIWQVEHSSEGDLNQRVLKDFTPVDRNGDPLPAGFYFITLDSKQVSHEGRTYLDTRMIIVSDASLTFKSTTTDALLWLTDLQAGTPIEGAPVTVFDQNFAPIGKGITDQDGKVYLTLPPPSQPYDHRYAMVDHSQSQDGTPHFAFASSEWGSGVNLYDYGIWSSYYAPANQPVVYLYTDRPIYRPNQPVYFKGIIRLDDDLSYHLPDKSKVKITLQSYDGVVAEQELDISEYGSFSGQFHLAQDAALGYYTIQAQFLGEESIIGEVSFNVAEYRRPEFRLDVAAAQPDVLAGGEFTVTVGADYYSGGGVSGAQVHWTVVAQPYNFSPKGPQAKELERFSFSSQELDSESYENYGENQSQLIAEGDAVTDETGRAILTIPADLSKFKTSQIFVVEATVTDLSGNAVSGRTSVNVHRSAVYIGARSKSYVGVVGEEQTFEFITVDWDGNLLAGQKLSVDVVERHWYSTQEQDAQGRVQWTSTVEEKPVTSFSDLSTDSTGKISVNFIPPAGGVFRAKATALDSANNPSYGSAYVWVSGDKFIPWRQTNDRSFQLIADRNSYVPGETAELLIASPFQGNSYALITVERGHIRYNEVTQLTNNSTIYKLPISADMAPNVYVSVVIVKGVDETNPRPNFKMGIVELKVSTEQQALTVEVTPDRTTAGPGEEVKYTVRTLDFKGAPVKTELSLGLSDLATLSLASPNSPSILDAFYSRRNLAVWTTIPIMLDIEDYNASIKEYLAEGSAAGSGGGKGGGDEGVIEVRQDFPDTAYWEAHLVTDDSGVVTATVTLPDNLTTWRMDVRGVTLDTRVGQITNDLISTKSLLVRPQTPRFFVVGDQSRVGAAIHNNTDQSMTVNVSLDSKGLQVQGETAQNQEIPAHKQIYVTWDVVIDQDAQRVDLVFLAEGTDSNGLRFTDASRPTIGTLDNQGLPVYRYEAHETVGTSGMMNTGGSLVEAISLPSTMAVSAGDLTIKASPSLAAGMTDGLKYLEHYPYECVEQTISRFLPNVISTRALKSAGLSNPDLEKNLEEQVNIALQRLYNWQNSDGGWGWWGYQKSNVQTTAYASLGLIEAKEAGYVVREDALKNALDFMEKQLISFERPAEPFLLNQQSFVLYVLARAERFDAGRATQLYEQRQRMALFGRAYLAQTLALSDQTDARIKTLLSDLSSAAIVSATGTHWEEKEQDYWNWNTDTRTTAIILSVLSKLDAQNPLNANAVRWLMSNRSSKGHWSGTQETAWTLMSLTNWMVASGELNANYNFGIALNGERIGGGVANSSSLRDTTELRVSVADLLKDEANRLVIARDDGPGVLYYTAHMDLSLPVEQIQALDQGIVVSRSYYSLNEQDTPISQARVGDLLLVRLTVVTPHALHYVVIDDPLPAGLESINRELQTSPQNTPPENYGWKDLMERGWGWWIFDHVELRDEKVLLSVNYLPAGTYVYTYMVRASTPGTYKTIPTTAQEFYFPEVYGRGEGSLFTVLP